MKPELLVPSGDWISLREAVKKANATYFGVSGFNMRANAKNFELSEIKKIVEFCHKNKVKAYLTLNTIIYEEELEKVSKILKKAKEAKIDAIIAWDLSILKKCKDLGLKIHLSTQASVSNYEAAEYYCKQFSVKRIVLARECTLEDIKKIIVKIKKNKLKLEIETFIHGAMCVSVSGRCFLSQFVFNKSANRGECLQPCRRSYTIKDPEEGHEYELKNNFVMSPKDLCVMPFIEKLIDSGINSFKIEGRNRSPEYVKVVSESYREIIDYYCKLNNGKRKKELEKKNKEFDKLKKKLVEKLKTVYNRGFSSGFFMSRPVEAWTDAYGSKATKKKIYVGKVLNYYSKVKAAEIKIETGKIKEKDTIMIQGETTGIIEQKIESMQKDNKKIKEAKKGMNVAIKLKDKARKNDKVFIIKNQ